MKDPEYALYVMSRISSLQYAEERRLGRAKLLYRLTGGRLGAKQIARSTVYIAQCEAHITRLVAEHGR
jgi:hypothetical protein